MPVFKNPPRQTNSGRHKSVITEAAELAMTAPGKWVEADGEWSQAYSAQIRKGAGQPNGVRGMRTGAWEVTTRKNGEKWKIYIKYLGEEE